MSESHHHPPAGERDYADRDIPLKPIIRFTVGLTLFIVLVFWGIEVGLKKWLRAKDAADVPVSTFAQERIVPAGPLLQVNEQRTLAKQRAVEHEALMTYGWVGAPGGAVRIPVERAMDLVAERGLPTRELK